MRPALFLLCEPQVQMSVIYYFSLDPFRWCIWPLSCSRLRLYGQSVVRTLFRRLTEVPSHVPRLSFAHGFPRGPQNGCVCPIAPSSDQFATIMRNGTLQLWSDGKRFVCVTAVARKIFPFLLLYFLIFPHCGFAGFRVFSHLSLIFISCNKASYRATWKG